MGITFKEKNYSKKTFVEIQGHFGVKKSKLNYSLNMFILGFKYDFSIINSEFFIEQSKRIFLFCFSFIEKTNKFLFVNSSLFSKEFLSFLVYRSLESIITQKWINGLLTNSLWVKPAVLFVWDVKNILILQESYLKNLPLILLDNLSISLNKCFYFLFSNYFSKKLLYFYYKNLTNFILLSKLYKFSIK